MVTIGETYRLTCVCGHDFLEHIGQTEGFPCNQRNEHCMCSFYRPQRKA